MKISSQHTCGKVFGEPPAQVVALQDISLGVDDNEFVTLVGASGCGKSTLLRIIAGLEYHASGQVIANGRPVAGRERTAPWCSSSTRLFPWLTVYENIRFSRRLKADREELTSSDVKAASGRADAWSISSGSPASGALIRISSPAACSSAWRSRALCSGAADPADGRAVRRARRADP